MWAMHDTDGMLQLIKIPAFYVPKRKVRLLSMTSLLQTYKDEKIEIDETKLTLSGIPSEPTKGTVITRVNPMNNLPTSLSYHYGDTIKAMDALTMVISTVDEANLNLTEPEKELICWHCRLGHIGFRKVQFLMRTGVLSQSQRNRKLHTAACKIIHQSAPLASLESRSSVHLQGNNLLSSRIMMVCSRKTTSFPVNACLSIILCATPRVGCIRLKER